MESSCPEDYSLKTSPIGQTYVKLQKCLTVSGKKLMNDKGKDNEKAIEPFELMKIFHWKIDEIARTKFGYFSKSYKSVPERRLLRLIN